VLDYKFTYFINYWK